MEGRKYPQYIIEDSKPKCVYVSERNSGALKPSAEIVVYENDMVSEFDTIAPLPEIDENDICTFCYSSGTVGAPKGVMLSHKSILHSTYLVTTIVPVSHRMIHLSFLPISHLLERLAISAIMFVGGKIAFYPGVLKEIVPDYRISGATSGPTIPRLLEQIHAQIMESINEHKTLYKFCRLLNKACKFIGFRSRIADALLFKKVQDVFGGKLSWFAVAGDSFPADVHEDLQDILNIKLQVIYGLSEIAGPATCTPEWDIQPGTVGKPIPETELSIVDNEIRIKTQSMFTSYWGNDLARDLFVDGFLRTGDKGTYDKLGNVIVLGRSSDVFEFEPGFIIALPYITYMYKSNNYIRDIYIHPFPEKKCIVGIVVVDDIFYQYFTHSKNYNKKALSMNREFRAYVHSYINEYAEILKIMKLKRIFVWATDFDSGLYTPTGKQSRKEFTRAFEREIELMNRNIPAPATSSDE